MSWPRVLSYRDVCYYLEAEMATMDSALYISKKTITECAPGEARSILLQHRLCEAGPTPDNKLSSGVSISHSPDGAIHDDAFGLPTTSEWVSHVELTRGQWRFALTGKLITSLHLVSERSKLLAPQQAEIGGPGFYSVPTAGPG